MTTSPISIRDRAAVLPIETCAFLLALLERQSTIETAKEAAGTGLEKARQGGRWVRGRLGNLHSGPEDGPEGERDNAGTANEDTEQPPEPTEEELRAEQEEFKRLVESYLAKGDEVCRKELLARMFSIAGQGPDSRHERPVLSVAAKAVGFKAVDSIADQDLVYLVVTRMLSELQQQSELAIAKASDEERQALLERLGKELETMDADALERIRSALGVDNVTAGILLRSATSTGLAGAFALGVNAGGFGVYLALTTVIHAVATTLLGATLPFGVYAFATTFLSAATGGLLLVPVAGSWLLFHRRGRIREDKSKLPFVLTAIVLTTAEALPTVPSWNL
jgi:hypothetical protein